MGPRSDERGNAMYFNSRVRLFSLQWGRVRMNAEMLWRHARSVKTASFNGAAFG